MVEGEGEEEGGREGRELQGRARRKLSSRLKIMKTTNASEVGRELRVNICLPSISDISCGWQNPM